MSGGIIKHTVRQLCISVIASVLLLSANIYGATAAANAASKAPAVASAAKPTNVKGVAKAATKATPNAAKTQTKALTPPPVVGTQKVVSPDKAKSLVPDKSKLVESASLASPFLSKSDNKSKDAKNAPKKKVVKARKHVVDAKVISWGKSAEEAESYAFDSARKLVGSKDRYLIKDTVFIVDSPRVVCSMRVNFTDEIPENWYLESEMVTGFGKSRERAYADALVKAAGKAKIVQNTGDWINAQSTVKNASDMGVIPYEYTFAAIGKEYYCKLYFRYFMPR